MNEATAPLNSTLHIPATGVPLQPTIDRLLRWAAQLDEDLANAADVQEAQAIARTQQNLRACALDLVSRQVDLVVEGLRVTAEQVNTATEYAEAALARLRRWKARIARLDQVLGFLGTLASGDGVKILKAAISLRQDLDAA